MEKLKFSCLCLSLKKDTHRREHMLDISNKIKIPVNFFDAYCYENVTKENEDYFKNCDFYEWNINQKAVMATFISHMELLKYSILENKNLLIIEDDLDYVLPIDFENINFDDFDLYNVGLDLSCYSYFVSIRGAQKILNELNNKTITQAYDWELSKLQSIKKITTPNPHFIQLKDKFVSNIAPNGYVKY